VQTISTFAAAEAAFDAALQRGESSIELVLTAGTYDARNLTLEDGEMTAAVTLRGDGAVVFDGVGVTIVARSVTLSGLRFQGGRLLSLAQLEVQDHATVNDLHFIEAATRHPRGTPPLVDIVATGPAAQASVSGWTVARSALPLVALRVQPGGRFVAAHVKDIDATTAQGDLPAISAAPVDALTVKKVSLPDGAVLLALPHPTTVHTDGVE
jgi:hypothetical protein